MEKSIIDLQGAPQISFAKLREIINLTRQGNKVCLLNASDAVIARLHKTGVAGMVEIYSEAKTLDTSEYDNFGGGFLAQSYYSKDGDSVLKVYDERTPKEYVLREQSNARAVMLCGIPTPLVGDIYEKDGKYALDYERIQGKKSLSRIIADDPDKLEETAREFARLCKELHNTECNTSIFPDRSDYYRRIITDCKEISEPVRSNALRFIDNVPARTTCLHGDMQTGNVITDGKQYLWIDLADFSYGDPMYDMGMWFFLSNMIPEELSDNLFHCSCETMAKVWSFFFDEYFGADTDEKKAAAMARITPYTAIHVIALGHTHGFLPGMMDFIENAFRKA